MLALWRRGELRDLPPPSEPWHAFRDRVVASPAELVSSRQRWVVVAHAGLFRVVEAECDIEPRRVANLDGVRLRLVCGRVVAGHTEL